MDEKKSKGQTSVPKGNSTSEKVLGSLHPSWKAGGKIEQARQILKATQKTGRVRIDENDLTIFVDQ